MTYSVRDDMQRELIFAHPPRRVVSLVPSDTHSVWALGVGESLVGCTEYCEEPSGLREKLKSSGGIVGGTKNVDVEAVLALQPDLIIANKEENNRTQLGKLSAAGVPVFLSFPRTVADGIAHLARLATIFAIQKEMSVVKLIREGYTLTNSSNGSGTAEQAAFKELGHTAFVPIWKEPLMTINGDTFGSSALNWAGFKNVFTGRERKYPLAADIGTAKPLDKDDVGERDVRYPRITEAELAVKNPDVVLLPSEPHPFSEDDIEFFEKLPIEAARNKQIRLVDGKDLFWYGAWSIEGLPRLRAQAANGL